MRKNHKIKIFDIGEGNYSFVVDNFSSLKHAILCSSVKSTYKFAWDAYKDAKNVAENNEFHLDILNRKYASDEYSIDKPLDVKTEEISADNMLTNHYHELYNTFSDRAEGLPKNDKDEEKILYGEIKSVVSELLKVKENIKEESNKKEIDEILNKFSKLTKKYFCKLLKKDAAEEKEKANSTSSMPADQNAQQMPNTEQTGGQNGMGGDSPMPLALNKNQFVRMASKKEKFTTSEIKEIVDHYCDRICDALKKLDKNIIGSASRKEIVIKDNEGPMLQVDVNSHLLVSNIVPVGKLAKTYPISSVKFYQKYWKPIVEAVGHYYEREGVVLSGKLPDAPKHYPSIKEVKLCNCGNEVAIEFSESGNSKTWKVIEYKTKDKSDSKKYKEASSKYTEQDYFPNGVPAMVICLNPDLKSLFKKIGEVSRIFPLDSGIIIEVNFGNNVVVRLKEKDLEIIDVDNPPATGKEKITRKDEV